MSDLPRGWATTTLHDITVDCDKAPPSEGVSFTYIDIASVSRETKKIESPQHLNADNAPSRARKWVRRDDVIVSMTRPNLNAVAMVPKELDGQIASTGFDVLRAIQVEPRWIFFAVRSRDFIDAMSGLVQGALYPAVKSCDVRSFELPLPPLSEQQRIADKLDSLLSRVDSCRERLDRVPAILKRFRQSVLAAATSGKLTEDWREENGVDSDWEIKPLSETVSGLEQGWSPKCENFPSSSSEIWGVIKTTAIQELRFDETENKELPASLEPRPRFELQTGDILITRAGPRVRCGVACYVPTVRPKLMLCDKAYRFRAVETLVRPEYVAVALNAPETVIAIDKLKTGISESGMNLTQTKFKELEIPCPSIDEQDEILRRVRDLFSYADNVETQHQNACKQVDRLTPSLLAEAFRGELVPQDPNDEPASVLLERIRAAKPDTKKKALKRKAKAK